MKLTKPILAAIAFACLAAPAWAQGRGGDMLAAMDANGDGAVTRAEAQAARDTMFTRMDADGDGFISQAERAAMREETARRRQRGNADANGDGRVSRSEFMGQPFRGFDMADANNDGVVTGDEMAALRGRGRGG